MRLSSKTIRTGSITVANQRIKIGRPPDVRKYSLRMQNFFHVLKIQPGIENMKYDKEEDCYICAEGRKLYCRKVSTEVKNGIPVTRAWYRCENCRNCPQREKCCRKQDVNAPKEVIMKETFWEKRQRSLDNIISDRGIQLRINRSIQVEGAFGLIKNDFGFRRFLTTGKKNVRIELLFLTLGFNLKKRWMKQQKRRLETHYSEKKAV